MKKYIILAGLMLCVSFATQSCLDYDDPGTELGINQTTADNTNLQLGNPDSIFYKNIPTETSVDAAINSLTGEYFGYIVNGVYCMRGGKEGDIPKSHAYQRQYSLGPDLYAQYFVVPHTKFMYGQLTSTYNISAEFNNNPLGAYTTAKNAFMPVLHHPSIDSIPEIKAITLLYYSLIAQENADLSGPFTYLEDKMNSQTPSTYNTVKDIYHGIVENLDTIVNCLKYFENKPDWYKKKILALPIITPGEIPFTTTRQFITGEFNLQPYIKLANSLKLRMAMHIVKVDEETAKRWAEEAVASGVIESVEEQMGIFLMFNGFDHPLVQISDWGDIRLSASFESLLMSLNHPYATSLFNPNSNKIIDRNDPTKILEANTRVCGIRSGAYVYEGIGQTYAENMYQAYSTFNTNLKDGVPPLYFIKFAEVDFLRAEGAIRGWKMSEKEEENAQFFYERGITNADLYEPFMPQADLYRNALNDYMAQTEATPYTSIDPIGDGEPWESVTKIGVAWNDGDDPEIKLEKIITQKYIALFPLSTEAWTEMRRTGYPKLFPVQNPDDGDCSLFPGDIIRRIPWVPTDIASQKMVANSGIGALGGADEQATRLWWDVNVPNF